MTRDRTKSPAVRLVMGKAGDRNSADGERRRPSTLAAVDPWHLPDRVAHRQRSGLSGFLGPLSAQCLGRAPLGE